MLMSRSTRRSQSTQSRYPSCRCSIVCHVSATSKMRPSSTYSEMPAHCLVRRKRGFADSESTARCVDQNLWFPHTVTTCSRVFLASTSGRTGPNNAVRKCLLTGSSVRSLRSRSLVSRALAARSGCVFYLSPHRTADTRSHAPLCFSVPPNIEFSKPVSINQGTNMSTVASAATHHLYYSSGNSQRCGVLAPICVVGRLPSHVPAEPESARRFTHTVHIQSCWPRSASL